MNNIKRMELENIIKNNSRRLKALHRKDRWTAEDIENERKWKTQNRFYSGILHPNKPKERKDGATCHFCEDVIEGTIGEVCAGIAKRLVERNG